jgi:hypothetical protein
MLNVHAVHPKYVFLSGTGTNLYFLAANAQPRHGKAADNRQCCMQQPEPPEKNMQDMLMYVDVCNTIGNG